MYFYIYKVYIVFTKEYKIYILRGVLDGGLIIMALDKVLIGSRIRKIREDLFCESRAAFAKRCNLTERHIGQLERGEFLIGLLSLDNITTATGVDTDFILYGKGENDRLKIKQNLISFIDKADKDELQMYYKCITTIRTYVKKLNIS